MTYSSRLRKTLGITASLAMLFQTFAPVRTYAQTATPVISTSIEVLTDGTAPFDGTTFPTNDGEDSDTMNGVVRMVDIVTYGANVSINDAQADNVNFTITLDPGNGTTSGQGYRQTWVELPEDCLTGNDPYGRAYFPQSSISTDKQTFVCNVGTQPEGKLIQVPVAAQASQYNQNGESVAASISATADDANTASDASQSTIVTGDFGVNLVKELTPPNYIPDPNNPGQEILIYKPEYNVDDPNGGGAEGTVISYDISAQYKVGSSMAGNTNGLADFTIDDTFAYVGADAALPNNAVHYGCESIDGYATVTCPAVGTTATTPFQIQVDDADVTLPDGGNKLFNARVKIWVPESDVTAGGDAIETENNVNFAGGSHVGADNQPQSNDAVPLDNYDGAGEDVSDNVVEYELINLTLGSSSSHFVSTFSSSNSTALSRYPRKNTVGGVGEVLPLQLGIYTRGNVDKNLMACNNLDTTNLEFRGIQSPLADSPYVDGASGYQGARNDRLSTNPGFFTTSSSYAYALFGSALDYGLVIEYSTIDHTSNTSGGQIPQLESLCTDDMDTDGTYDWYDATECEPILGGSRGGSNCNISMGDVTKIRLTWNTDYDQLMTDIPTYYYPGSSRFYAVFSTFDVRIKDTATVGSKIPNYLRGSYNGGQSWRAVESALITDPSDPDYALSGGYFGHFGHRINVIAATSSIQKILDPELLQFVDAGEVVTIKTIPSINGSFGGKTDIEVEEDIPAGMSYIGGSMTTENCGTAQVVTESATPGVDGADIVWTISDVDAGESVCEISFDVKMNDFASAGMYTNTANLTTTNTNIEDFLYSESGTARVKKASSTVSILPGSTSFDVIKTSAEPVVEVEGEIDFSLTYANLGPGDYSAGEFIDILPYNGDGENITSGLDSNRTPGSAFAGTYELTSIAVANGETFMATTDDPTTIDMDPDSNTSTWTACTSLSPVTCGALDAADITAIKFATTTFPEGAVRRAIDITLTPTGNVDGDVYTNSFGGRVPEIDLPVISNDVSVEVVAGSIGDTVRFDADGSGDYTAGEEFAGMTVTLTKPDASTQTTVTDVNGNYSFNNLPSGSYTVAIDTPASWTNLADEYPSDATEDGSTAVTLSPVLDANNDLESISSPDDVDFGVSGTLGSVSGYVYADADDSDDRQGTENGIGGQDVYLNGVDDAGNAVSLTMATGADGSYSFDNLLGGTYEVSYMNSSADHVSDSTETVDGTGASTTVIQNINLGLGEISVDNNFGLLEFSSLSGMIYYDVDGSDSNNAGDTGIDGQTVILQGTDVQGNNVLLTTQTSGGGGYTFADVLPSDATGYTVSYANADTSYVADSAQTGGEGGVISSSQIISTIVVDQGVDSDGYDFGLDEVDVSGTIAGYVYSDEDSSDLFNTGDVGLAGVTVTLTGTTNDGAAINTTAITDVAGAYLFTDVDPGMYEVSYTSPTGYTPSASNTGTGATDNGSAGAGFTSIETIDFDANQDVVGINFGASYIDVTTDISCNQTTAQPGDILDCFVSYSNQGTTTVNSADVDLALPSGRTFVGTAPSITNQQIFAGQTLGSIFKVQVPVDQTLVGSQFGIESEIEPNTDEVNVLSNIDTQDIMIVGFDTANVAGTVYADEDGSDTYSSGDMPLENIEVTLNGTDEYGVAVTMTQLTSVGGDYNFVVQPGNYTITYDASTAGSYVPDSAQSDDGDVSSNILIEKLNVPVVNAVSLENNDFGLTSLDLETTIDCTPNPAVVGSTVTCTVNYENLSSVTANKPDITTIIPAELINVTGTTSDNPTDIAPGATGSFTFTATVDPSFTGSEVDVSSAISAAESEVNMSNNNATDTLYISASTDTMTLEGSIMTAGGDPIVAQNVVITGVEPDGTLVNMTVPTNSNGEYAFAGLVPGTYEVSYAPATGYTPTSSAAGSEGGDDTDTSHTVISKIVLELDDKPSKYDFVVDYVDLQVSINCAPQYPNPGTDVVCTIDYSNIGGLDATGVNLTGTFPTGYTTTDTLPTGLTVAAGTSGSTTMTFSIPDDVAVVGVTENFKTTISADQTETDTDNNTATDEVRPEIASNNPPVANNDSSTTAINTTLTGTTLFVNDNDPDGDTISLDATNSDTTSTNGGTVVINTDGTYTYTPATDFTGTDTFMYTICDDATPALCDEATVLVEVTATAPIANNDFVEVAENEVATIDVLANDTPYSPGDVLMITPSSVVASTGTVIINTDGELEITPPTDYVGTITVVYEICDEDNECSTATVVVNVDEIVPNEPVAVNDMYTTTEDTATTVNIAANDTDPDNNLDLTTISLISQPANGTVVVGTGGEVTYTPNAEFAGVDIFVYEVCDDSDPVLCDVAVVEMTVEAVNDAPVATNESVSTNEDTAVTIDVQSNDTDIENDTLTTTQITADPASGTVSINTDGTVMYTPAADFTGTDTFEYEICDDGTPVMCDTAEVSITVDPVNDTPMAMDDSETTVEDMPVTIDVLANDDDVDGTLTVTQIMTQPANGTVVINTDGTLTYTPNADYNNTAADLDVFTYEACDDSDPAECDTASVDMMVTPDAESDVSVTVTCTPENALGGEEVVCVVSYENTGNDAAEDVEITLEYPSWMEITEFPTVAGTTCRFGSVICGGTGWTVGAGESGSYDVAGTIAADAGSQIGEVSVSVATSTDETTMTNNTAMDAVTAYVPVVPSRGGGRSPSSTTSTNTGTTDIVIAEPEPVEDVVVSEPEIEFTDEEEKIIEKIEEIKKEEEKRKNPTPLELGNVERGNEGRSHFVAPSYLPATGADV